MSDDDKKLKEIFKREIDDLIDGAPDFRLMMNKEVEKPTKKNWITLRIAASVLLMIGAGVFLIIKNQAHKPESNSLSEWNEPTQELMTLTSSRLATVSNWSSPTDFLLSDTRQIKN